MGTEEDSTPEAEERGEREEREEREKQKGQKEQEEQEEQKEQEERVEQGEGERRKKRVAIVGSGPAGLTAAYFLALKGYSVKIFERLPVAGGMLSAGIPPYRLPRDALQRDIEYIKRAGVEIECGVEVNREKFKEICEEYDAVFVAVGAHKSRRMGIEGEDLQGVFHGVDFLRRLNLGGETERERLKRIVGKRVLVVGGGDVAIDVARSAVRLGAEVTIAYRRSREEMPARDEEVHEAEEEGVKFMFLVNPKRIIGERKVEKVELIRMKLGAPDETGRRKPIPIEGSEFLFDADSVIIAIGQQVEWDFLEGSGVKVERGVVKTDRNGYTGVKNIFAGGDCVSGPATVVEAVSAGRKAAEAIHKFLRGEALGEAEVAEEGEEKAKKISIEEVGIPKERKGRVTMPKIPLERRLRSFECVELGYDEEAAREEASRCLHCKLCCECGVCESVCEADAINHKMTDEIVNLDVGAIVVATGFDIYDPSLDEKYGYKYDEVITSLEFERLVNASGPTGGKIIVNGREPRRIVFISCVGSRSEERPYCSRICCMYIMKQAHLIKEKIPDADITVLYTDVRAYGKGYEEFYEKVRSEVSYVRRELDEPIEVIKQTGNLVVRAVCEGKQREFPADIVVLATAVVPREDAISLTRMLKITQSADKFFLEAHPKLRPVETLTEGIFIAGCCQSPKDIPDTVAQASAAASMACSLLTKEYLEIEPIVAVVDERKCIGCASCTAVCPFNAIEMRDIEERLGEITLKTRKSFVNPVLCKGCGACISECPVGALNQKHFTSEQINAMIPAALS
ncbi:MAG: FAD-dependent oxidoreductase [Candidatus Methanospirare jalkutatii]|nr:MAG: FAD-dependent oxidoreductase [Candidatus Methanospirare jalkutatii]